MKRRPREKVDNRGVLEKVERAINERSSRGGVVVVVGVGVGVGLVVLGDIRVETKEA